MKGMQRVSFENFVSMGPLGAGLGPARELRASGRLWRADAARTMAGYPRVRELSMEGFGRFGTFASTEGSARPSYEDA